jgi:hypothetical protein
MVISQWLQTLQIICGFGMDARTCHQQMQCCDARVAWLAWHPMTTMIVLQHWQGLAQVPLTIAGFNRRQKQTLYGIHDSTRCMRECWLGVQDSSEAVRLEVALQALQDH